MLLVILFLFLGLVLILTVPVSLSYRASLQQELRGQIELRWAFGLIRLKRNFPATRTATTQSGNRKHNEAAPGRSLLAAWRQPLFRRRLIRLVGDLWRALEKSAFRTSLRIGLDDPAATGRLWAIIGPIAGMFAAHGNAYLLFEPVFHECRFDLDSSGKIRVTPLEIITILLGFFLSPVVWKAFRHDRSVE